MLSGSRSIRCRGPSNLHEAKAGIESSCHLVLQHIADPHPFHAGNRCDLLQRRTTVALSLVPPIDHEAIAGCLHCLVLCLINLVHGGIRRRVGRHRWPAARIGIKMGLGNRRGCLPLGLPGRGLSSSPATACQLPAVTSLRLTMSRMPHLPVGRQSIGLRCSEQIPISS